PKPGEWLTPLSLPTGRSLDQRTRFWAGPIPPAPLALFSFRQEGDFMSFSLSGRQFPATRLRRNRFSEFSRRLVRETSLSASDFIYPMFVIEGAGQREPIASMPGIERVSIDELKKEVEELLELGVPAIA